MLFTNKPLPQNEWIIGWIEEVWSAQDGLVRAAMVKTRNGGAE